MNLLKRLSTLFLSQVLLLEFQDLVIGTLNNQGALTQQMFLESTIKRMEPQGVVPTIGKYKIVHQEYHGLDTVTALLQLQLGTRNLEGPVYKNGVLFSRQDIKALLAGVYMSAGFKFLGGTRCERSLRNYNPTSNLDSCQDINPGLFHTVVANWIGRRKQSIIFDRNGDNQVWNYPLYGYQSYSQEISASKAMRLTGGGGSNYTPNRDAAKFLEVTTNITYADAVNGYEVLDYNQEGRMSYSYVLELSGDGNHWWSLGHKESNRASRFFMDSFRAKEG